MRFARGLVLLLAFSCAAGAALLVQKTTRPASRPTTTAKPEMVEILVAARAISVGETVGKDEVRWQSWPRQAVPDGSIRRAPNSGGSLPFEALPARFAMLEGEPVAEAKLLQPNDGSALAALLAPGMRAVSVPIREESAAGGFIQPGDRVDVMVTRRQADAGRGPARSEVLLRAVKVLAVGKALQARPAANGRTATLELAPAQVGLLTAAQSAGEIALALIGPGDIAQIHADADFPDETFRDVRMLKYGRSANRPFLQ